MKFFKTICFGLLIISGLQSINAQNSNFQNKCGTGSPSRNWEAEFQKLVTQHTLNQTAGKPQQAYVIPVIVHIIHGGQPVGTYPNVSQAQTSQQIATLNNDLAGTGVYTANYPANAFAAWASTANVSPASLDANGRVAIANCNIQFCLATQDTNGNVLPEPGIDRINYNTMGWSNPASPSFSTLPTFYNLFDNIIKPQTIWDVTKYLNIWVSENNPYLGLAGYAAYPYLSTLNDLPLNDIGTATTDGIWCRAVNFGYMGHVVSHEAGHWLGVWHTWGDSLCGNDYCNDTPRAPAPTFGSPNYPYNVNGCTGSGNGVMFMNFMDYTDNEGIYMFTTDQANRMQTAMANSPYRKDLGTHNLCSVENVAAVSWFISANTICTGKTLNLSNESLGWPAPLSYTWSSSGGTFNPGPQAVSPGIQFSTPGIYTITLASSNGTVSVYTKTITVTSPSIYFSSTSQTICQGAVANFTVDGVNTYTWQPGNVMNSVVSFTPSSSQTYTCEALEVNNCRTSGVVEVVVSPCTGMDAWSENQLTLSIYPNPAKEILNLEINTNQIPKVTIWITDAIGRILHHENADVRSKDQLFPIDISSFDTGIYFIKVQSPDGLINSHKFVKKE